MPGEALQRALQVIHDEPSARWTLDGLARAAAVSRSTLTERFAATLGDSPMA